MTESHEKLRVRLQESFSPSYLTLISILQSMLLGYLAAEFNNNIDSIYDIGNEVFIRAITSLLVIIVTWNEYRMGATQFVWFPKTTDTIVPFGVAIAEFFVIRYSFEPSNSWFYSMSFFYFTSFVGFYHMYFRAERLTINKESLNKDILDVIGTGVEIDKAACIAYLIVTLLFGFSISKYDLSETIQIIMSLTTLVLLVIFMIHSERQWQRIIRFSKQREE